MANALVDFSTHTVSLVAITTDQYRHGRPVTGIAFNSIGRFAQSGILRERMIPRLQDAMLTDLLTADGAGLDPAAVARTILANEKPGGHGDRAGAAAALELAAWDLNAKLADEPAWAHLSRVLGTQPHTRGTPVYAAGGYYYADDSLSRLRDELRAYAEHGYPAVKMKIGGAALDKDLARVAAAIEIMGAAEAVAVDANGRFKAEDAFAYADALAPLGLRWFEEPCDPLDYALTAALAEAYAGPLATGENLFAAMEVNNLLQFGGLRPDRDLLQMDPGLAYGLTEYARMVALAGQAGFDRAQLVPHGGHLINLHIVTALGLGGCEAYPGVFAPFGGFAPQCRVHNGRVWPSDAPGWGLEQKAELAPYLERLTEP